MKSFYLSEIGKIKKLGFVIAILSQISFVDLVNAHTCVCKKCNCKKLQHRKWLFVWFLSSKSFTKNDAPHLPLYIVGSPLFDFDNWIFFTVLEKTDLKRREKWMTNHCSMFTEWCVKNFNGRQLLWKHFNTYRNLGK